MNSDGHKTEPAQHRIGRRGEDAAAVLVQQRGWKIVARNRRMARGEADIVAVRDMDGVKQGLVVEVKASKRPHDDIAVRVSRSKQQRMFAMAEQLLAEEKLDEAHVAIIAVRLLRDHEELHWIDLDAF